MDFKMDSLDKMLGWGRVGNKGRELMDSPSGERTMKGK